VYKYEFRTENIMGSYYIILTAMLWRNKDVY